MKRHHQSGFSLLELIIVVAIITVLSAIAIPSYLKARQSAYEAAAQGTMHTVQTEQLAYRTVHGSYATSFRQLPNIVPDPGTLTDGGSSGTLPSAFSGLTSSSGGPSSTIIRQSYVFTMTNVNDEEWYCTAQPILDRNNGTYYYTDDTGRVRSVKGSSNLDSGFAQ